MASNSFPLTKGQEALWFLEQLNPDRANYNICAAVNVKPKLEKNLVNKTLNVLLTRHEALRTRFFMDENAGGPRQSVRQQWHITTPIIDCTSLLDRELREMLREKSQIPFDLENDLPVRTEVLQRKDASIIFISIHHIVADFWSIALLTEEFFKIYSNLSLKIDPELSSTELSYSEYCRRSLKWLDTPAAEQAKRYWLDKLQGNLPVLYFGEQQPLIAEDEYGKHTSFQLSSHQTSVIESQARKFSVTPFSILLACYFKLLNTITSHNDIVVGIPIIGRSKSNEKTLVSYCVNPSPVRQCDLTERSFKDLCQSIHQDIKAAIARQRYPFSELVKLLDIDRNADIAPVFQTMFAFQKAQKNQNNFLAALAVNYESELFSIGNHHISSFPFDANVAQFPLSLTMAQVNDIYSGIFEYDLKFFNNNDINQVINAYKNIIDRETSGIISSQTTRHGYKEPVSNDFAELILENIRQHPGSTALFQNGTTMSYRELGQRCSEWLNAFESAGVTENDVILVILPQGFELIIASLAVLLNKSILLPLDLYTPANRLQHYIEISNAKYIICHDKTYELSNSSIKQLYLARSQLIDHKPVTRKVNDEKCAALVFTSGSTGHPKCVALSHVNLNYLARTMQNSYNLTRSDRILQFTSPSFDVFLEELLPAFCSGATLIPKPKTMTTDIEQFESFLEKNKITIINIPTAYWVAWVNQMPGLRREILSSLRLVIVGGETLPIDTLTQWQRSMPSRIAVINAYGPAELTVTSNIFQAEKVEPHQIDVPVGKPLPGVECLIVNGELNPVNEGEEGELLLRGPGLAIGYLNNPDAEIQKFITLERQSSRWFRTGDLAIRDSNGLIHLRGRTDDQIKIHGVRLEPREIEKMILEIEGISKCWVTLVNGQLVSFIESEEDQFEAIRVHLKERVLNQMIPTRCFHFPQFPQTLSGKIDRQTLLSWISDGRPADIPSYLDKDSLALIQGEFFKYLGKNIDVNDNFFSRGVDSIIAVSIAVGLSRRLNKHIAVRVMFDNPTILKLHQVIDELPVTTNTIQIETDTGNLVPLTPAQKRVNYLRQYLSDIHTSEIFILEFNGIIDSLHFRESWLSTVSSYDIFSLRFTGRKGALYQQLAENINHELLYINKLDTTVENLLDKLKRTYLRTDSPNSPVIKAVLIRNSEKTHTFIISVNALACDTESMELVLKTFETRYNNDLVKIPEISEFSDEPEVNSTETTDIREPGGNLSENIEPRQYGQTSYLQYARYVSTLDSSIEYWRQYLLDCDTAPKNAIKLPLSNLSDRYGTIEFELDSHIKQKFDEFSEKYQVTPAAVWYSTFLAVLKKYCHDSGTIGIGTAITQRGVLNTANTPGLFTNFTVIAPRFEDNAVLLDIIYKVQQDFLQALENQQIEISNMLDFIDKKGSTIPVENIFVYHTRPIETLNLHGASCKYVETAASPLPALIFLDVTQQQESFSVRLHYNSGVFTRNSIGAFCQSIVEIITHIRHNASVAFKDLQVIPSELKALCYGKKVEWEEDCELLHTTFSLTARKHPLRIAVINNNNHISYGHLYRLSNKIARLIFEFSSQHRPLVVGILIDKGWEQIVAALGILRGGGVFAPINHQLCEKAIMDLLEHNQISTVITTALYKKLYQWPVGVNVFTLQDRQIRDMSTIPLMKRTVAVRPNDPAYIMFTSGTTGNPKGVLISHESALNTIYEINRRLEVTSKDTLFALSNFHFDLSIYDMFGIFLAGARIVIPDQDRHLDLSHWEELCQQHNVTIWNSVPSLYKLYIEQLNKPNNELRQVLLSGDWIPPDLPAKNKAKCPNASLLGLGGATEASIWSIGYDISKHFAENSAIPYGLPLANQNCYVLDRNLNLCPADVAGELYIGGKGVALEYYKNSTATSFAFQWHPFFNDRIYKTGDLAKLTSSGYFDILGRLDSRIKISGQFVDTSVIESALIKYDGVDQLVVVAIDNPGERTYLHVFFTIHNADNFSTGEFLRYIRQQLSGPMIPRWVSIVDALPLTGNGKVDRNLLKQYQGEHIKVDIDYVAPRTEPERKIQALWQSLLNLEEIGIDENFFEIGGDSLLTVSLASGISRIFNIELSVQTLFIHQTIRESAGAVSALLDNKKDDNQSATDSGIFKGESISVLKQEVHIDETINTIQLDTNVSYGLGSHVLLTGSTGYLGTRLIIELITQTNATVYCLVRSGDINEAMDSIAGNIASITSLDDSQLSRIVPIKGDLSKPLLGLSRHDYSLLSDTIDHIIHCGAVVNFILPRNALKSANIQGTIEILRIATQKRLKKVSYISTVSVFPTIANNLQKRFKEDDLLDQGLPIVGGYSQTKWISENNVLIARERGVPVNIYRPGVIFGDTRLGDLPTDVLLVGFLKVCAQMQAIPDLDILVDISPVDYVAKAIVYLSHEVDNCNYHLTNPNPVHLKEFAQILQRMGLPIQSVSQREWLKRFKTLDRSSAGNLDLLFSLVEQVDNIGEVAFGRNLQEFDCTNTLRDLPADEIFCPLIDEDFLALYIDKLAAK